MNLLLLLSALLSALTGMGAARGEATPRAVCTSVTAACAPSAARTAVVARPLQPLVRLAAVSGTTGRVLVLAPIEALFASRRRE